FSTIDGATLIPASSRSLFVISLSMHTAELRTLQPAYGSSANSRSPCILPSSPAVPCRIGSTVSSSISFPSAVRHSVGITDIFLLFELSSISIFLLSAARSHSPCLVILIRLILYFSLLSASNTLFAERTDTSCSVDLPPYIIPTFILFIL